MSTLTLDDLRRLLEEYGVEAEPRDAKARTRARILRAATTLFCKHGYRRTSVDAVAHEAGVAKGTVYLHFKTKAELLIHTVAEEKKRYFGRLGPVLDESLQPAARLEGYLALAFRLLAEMPLVSRLMQGDREVLAVLEEAGPDFAQQTLALQRQVMEAMLHGIGAFDTLAADERHARSRVLVGLLYAAGHLIDPRLRGDMPLKRYAQVLAKVIVGGLGAP